MAKKTKKTSNAQKVGYNDKWIEELSDIITKPKRDLKIFEEMKDSKEGNVVLTVIYETATEIIEEKYTYTEHLPLAICLLLQSLAEEHPNVRYVVTKTNVGYFIKNVIEQKNRMYERTHRELANAGVTLELQERRKRK